MDAVIEEVIFFARHLVDPIHVHRVQRMTLVYREALGATVKLPRAGKDNLDPWITGAAGFENRKLSVAINLEIGHRVSHRIEMTGLAGKVEKIILSLDEVMH